MSKNEEHITRKGVGVIESAIGESATLAAKGGVVVGAVWGVAELITQHVNEHQEMNPLSIAGHTIAGVAIGIMAGAGVGLFHGAHKAHAAQDQFTELRVENAALKAENKALHKIMDSSYLGTVTQTPALGLHT